MAVQDEIARFDDNSSLHAASKASAPNFTLKHQDKVSSSLAHLSSAIVRHDFSLAHQSERDFIAAMVGGPRHVVHDVGELLQMEGAKTGRCTSVLDDLLYVLDLLRFSFAVGRQVLCSNLVFGRDRPG